MTQLTDINQEHSSSLNELELSTQRRSHEAESPDDDGGDNDSTDDITVIVVEPGNDLDGNSFWTEDSPEMDERRRMILLRELERVQRASFIHFLILCLIPTSLLFVVLITVLGEDDVCESAATICEQEKRTFINAFTTRCVCNAIPVSSEP